MQKPRLLTGDTPTGRLHLGHWVGTVENRVAMQDDYDCYFLIANMHAFTTRATHAKAIRASVLDLAIDYLACGIDPKRSHIFIQSEVPAIAELTFFFSMLLPFARVLRNPTLKDEIRDKSLGDNYPFGFPLYAVGQTADILAFRPETVPVGEDQVPHLEMAREVARRFNQYYCEVDSHVLDHEHLAQGGLFPVIAPKIGRVPRLVGLGGPNAQGNLLKMSKSLNNAIFLSDDPDTIKKKIMGMYTDPKRVHASDPGTIINNPLWIFHETFNPDKAWIQEAQEKYRHGQIGDVECKRKLIDVLVDLVEPMRQQRLEFEKSEDYILEILQQGTAEANAIAEVTVAKAKEAMQQGYFTRELTIKTR